jgi:hypothetical protein
MNAVAVWRTLRALRWVLWLGIIAYYVYVAAFRDDHLTAFGHLLRSTEMFMFGLPVAAMFAGLLELWAREIAGVPKPSLFGGPRPEAEGSNGGPTGLPR